MLISPFTTLEGVSNLNPSSEGLIIPFTAVNTIESRALGPISFFPKITDFERNKWACQVYRD